MKIELGRTYRTRNGEHVTIRHRTGPSPSPYVFSDYQGRTYTSEGFYAASDDNHDLTLVSLVEEPIRPQATDHDVRQRAMHNADAPYDQRTCTNYPWAAAARIEWLEQNLKMSDDIGNGLQRELKNLNETHARQRVQLNDLRVRLKRAEERDEHLVNYLAPAQAPPPIIAPAGLITKERDEQWTRPGGGIGWVPAPHRMITSDQLRLYIELIEEIQSIEVRLNRSVSDVAKHIYDPVLRNMVECDMRTRRAGEIDQLKRKIKEMGLPLVEEPPATMGTQKAVGDGPRDQ